MTAAGAPGAPADGDTLAERAGLIAPRRRGFEVPAGSHASEPPEHHGVARDEVRLLASTSRGVSHHRFLDLPDLLQPGDLLVVNTSATLPAALRVSRAATAQPALLHFGGQRDQGDWVVELRNATNTGPDGDVTVGERLLLEGGARLRVLSSYPRSGQRGSRLWLARPDRTLDVTAYLHAFGRPIRYGYVARQWPLTYLQTVYADQPGSAEMPSAGRPFTPRVLTRLVTRGVTLAPLVLHTGLSSPEKHEPPAPEWFHVPEATARLVNDTRAAGDRVIAVGTTAVRALESAVGGDGLVAPVEGWTDLVVQSSRPVRVVDGLITGLHEPEASHLLMLDAVAGAQLVDQGYVAAVAERYRWHEFGDSMLLLP